MGETEEFFEPKQEKQKNTKNNINTYIFFSKLAKINITTKNSRNNNATSKFFFFFFLLIVSFFIFAAIFPNRFPNTIEKKTLPNTTKTTYFLFFSSSPSLTQ